MNQIIKGGIICLLSFLCLQGVKGQNQIEADTDPKSKTFGQVKSPELTKAALDQLENSSLTFDEWSSIFSVRVSKDARPTLGSYSIQKNQIIFKPRFLPDPNIVYLITFSYQRLNEVFGTGLSDIEINKKIQFKSANYLATQITEITPRADSLPANLLGVYLHFNGPMGFENPYSYINLYDEQKRLIKDAFVELPEGLWNENRTRLTLLFHPGRVKRGVGPNVKQGSIFEEGKSFTIQVSNQWTDANGNQLTYPFTKSIVAIGAVRAKMSVESWIVNTTCNDSCRILIKPDHLLDLEMAIRYLQLKDSNNQAIPIKITSRRDGSIELKSSSILPGKTYHMIIDPQLEDVCGNTFLNSFDYKSGTREMKGKEIKLQISTKGQ